MSESKRDAFFGWAAAVAVVLMVGWAVWDTVVTNRECRAKTCKEGSSPVLIQRRCFCAETPR